MLDRITSLNTVIKGELWYDFYIASFDGENILIKGTLDISYGHNLEITMSGVSYIDAPMEWKIDTEEAVVVRLFSNEDIEYQTRLRFLDKASGFVLGFRAEFFDSKQWIYFVAQSLNYVHKGKWDLWDWYEGANPPQIAGIEP